MSNIAKIYFRAIFVIGVFVLVSALLDIVVLSGPSIADSLFSPSTKGRCESPRKGMSKADVLRNLAGSSPPQYQRLDGNRIEFAQREDGVCTVEIDSTTDHVISTHFEAVHPPQWDTRGDR